MRRERSLVGGRAQCNHTGSFERFGSAFGSKEDPGEGTFHTAAKKQGPAKPEAWAIDIIELPFIEIMINYYDHNSRTGSEYLYSLKEIYPHHAWLNPIPERFWAHPTIEAIASMFPMKELTLEGLSEAIELLSREVPKA